jgi:carboxylesterase
MDGIGSDIADPEVTELAYPGTPLPPLLSFQRDGLSPLSKTYSANDVPLLLFTSTQDHVVPPQQSADLFAMYKGPKEQVMLERSFHVATQDFDKQEIFDKSVAFARRITS